MESIVELAVLIFHLTIRISLPPRRIRVRKYRWVLTHSKQCMLRANSLAEVASAKLGGGEAVIVL